MCFVLIQIDYKNLTKMIGLSKPKIDNYDIL